mmetsp:Transcript_6363/g.8858  ORF Transcript_6363/g.8858 Transcript_6363/m.8858 type:complete len:112 (+) Transcript_6363:913-1248(+)
MPGENYCTEEPASPSRFCSKGHIQRNNEAKYILVSVIFQLKEQYKCCHFDNGREMTIAAFPAPSFHDILVQRKQAVFSPSFLKDQHEFVSVEMVKAVSVIALESYLLSKQP